MKRSRRWLFGATAAISLLASISLLCWVYGSGGYGGRAYALLRPNQKQTWFVLFINRGRVYLDSTTFQISGIDTIGITSGFQGLNKYARLELKAGDDADLAANGNPAPPMNVVLISTTEITKPIWLVASLLFLWPCLWLIFQIRWRAKDPRLCPTCGYDLRATPNRCPECGAVPPKKEIAPT